MVVPAGMLAPTGSSARVASLPPLSELSRRAAPAGRRRTFDAWRSDFEADVAGRLEAAGVAGAAVAITSPDTAVRYVAAFGSADRATERALTVETPMHLASVSKLFTATALVQLFEDRGLDLHADVDEFLDFSVRNPRHGRIPITAQQLITHTSSISDEGHGDVSFPGDPTQSLADFLRNYLAKGGDAYNPKTSFSRAKPGTAWDYCNVGAALAGYVVERVSGQSFDAYVREHLFERLGVTNAHWYLRDFAPDVLAKPYTFENGAFTELPQQGYPDVPAGMLRCSVTDLATSLNAMIGQAGDDRAILSSRAAKQMLRRQVDRKIYPYQGLGWTSEEARRKVVGHTGSDNGASNMVALTTDRRQAVALLMNTDGTPESGEFRASVVEDLLAGALLAR